MPVFEAMRRNAIEALFPVLWGGRLTLFSEANFAGGGKKLLAFNRVLERTWNLGDPVVWICTRARCEILHMSSKQYGREIGCAPNTISTFESSPLSLQTFSKALSGNMQFWTRIVNSRVLEKSSRQQLQEARDYVLKVIDDHFDGGVFGLLMQWKYQCGSAAFEAAYFGSRRKSGLSAENYIKDLLAKMAAQAKVDGRQDLHLILSASLTRFSNR